MIISNEKVAYQAPTYQNWAGRATNPTLGNQYWHQAIELINIEKQKITNTDVALLGYICDEGVRRNLGRVGAKEGPKAIRERLGKVALHHHKKIADVGDVICTDQHMEDCQETYANIVTQLIKNKTLPIGIGGGHDIAYATFKGLFNALNNAPKNIGILNFDAHFDLRPVETQPNSGTPFNQILNEFTSSRTNINYLPIGIQNQANTQELFTIVKEKNITFVNNLNCKFDAIQKKLNTFVNQNDYIYITIDLDGFSSAYASGVSAPSPLGFTPNFVIEALEVLLKSNKVIACDIAELNPKYDIDNQTATLAARLIDYICLFY